MSHFIFLISTYYEMQGLQLNFGEFQNLFGRTFLFFIYHSLRHVIHTFVMYLKKYSSPTKETIAWLTLINSFLKVDVLNVINPKNVVKHIKVDEKAHYHTDVEKKCSMAQTRRPVLASHYIVNKINSNSGIFRTRSMHLCLWYAFL